jgi:hypothetical protein
MRAAGPPKQYLGVGSPLPILMEELKRHKSVRYVSIQRGRDSLVLQNPASA